MLVSCTCSSKEVAELPYGVVLDEDGNPSTFAVGVNSADIFKNKNNVVVDLGEWIDKGGSRSELYEQINFVVRVKNTGATGIVIFTATVYDYAENGVLGDDQQKLSFSLAKDAEDTITFSFFKRDDSTSKFKVQAVNAADFVIEEE